MGFVRELTGSRQKIRDLLIEVLKIPEIGVVIPLVALILIFGTLNPAFYRQASITNILRTMSYIGIVSIPVTFVFISQGLDLSVGSVAGLAGVLAGMAMRAGIPIPVSVLLGLCGGASVGLVNGLLIAVGRLPSFIVTMATMSAARGVIYVLTEGALVYPLPEAFVAFGRAKICMLSYSIFIYAALALAGGYVLHRTTFGRSLYAMGGNEATARLAGIPVERFRVIVYTLSALGASIAGILLVSRVEAGAPALGETWELSAIAGVVLGGTSLAGGRGTMLGTVLGTALMVVVSVGLVLVKVDPLTQQIALGGIMVVAVWLDQVRRASLGEGD